MEVITGKSIEEKVMESITPKNLLIEGKDDKGKWKELNAKKTNLSIC